MPGAQYGFHVVTPEPIRLRRDAVVPVSRTCTLQIWISESRVRRLGVGVDALAVFHSVSECGSPYARGAPAAHRGIRRVAAEAESGDHGWQLDMIDAISRLRQGPSPRSPRSTPPAARSRTSPRFACGGSWRSGPRTSRSLRREFGASMVHGSFWRSSRSSPWGRRGRSPGTGCRPRRSRRTVLVQVLGEPAMQSPACQPRAAQGVRLVSLAVGHIPSATAQPAPRLKSVLCRCALVEGGHRSQLVTRHAPCHP